LKNTSTVIASFLLFFFSAALFAASLTGRVTVRAESHAERGLFNRGSEEETGDSTELEKAGYLKIPLPEGVEETDVTIQNNPFENRIFIRISGADEDYYRTNFFSGDMTGIEDVRYGYADGVSTVELITGEVRIPVCEYTPGSFFVKVLPPRDIYERIIGVDSGHGVNDPGSVVYGIEERSITAAVAGRLCNFLQDGKTMVCLSVPDETVKSEKERSDMINSLEPDLLISIHTGADPDTRVTNGVEIASSSDQADKAEELSALISSACDQKNLGSSVRSFPGLTEYLKVPYLRIKLGIITNRYEAEKMNSEDYQEKVSRTIAAFINGTGSFAAGSAISAGGGF